MLKFEIASPDVRSKNKTTQTGEHYISRSQEAFYFKANQKYPTPCIIDIARDGQPYPVGFYTIDPESYYVNRFGRLDVFPRLLPLSPAEKTKATA